MRLIDADKLALYLNDYALTEAPDERESAGERRISNEIYNTIQNCMKAVDNQPTAFDVDKISKEIPKKPITYPGTNRADCPVCMKTVRGIGKPFGKYCAGCGQRLKWETEPYVENWLEESGQVEDGGVE